ncbi:mediator complex subunit [Sorochytrium milnesiophthora]
MSAPNWRNNFAASDREKVQQALLTTLQQLPVINKDTTRLRTFAENFESRQFQGAVSRQEYLESVKKKITDLKSAAESARQKQQQQQHQQQLHLQQTKQQQLSQAAPNVNAAAQPAVAAAAAAAAAMIQNNNEKAPVTTQPPQPPVAQVPPPALLQTLQQQPQPSQQQASQAPPALMMNPQNPTVDEIPLITKGLMPLVQATDKLSQALAAHKDKLRPDYQQLLINWSRMKEMYIKHCTEIPKRMFLLGTRELDKLSEQTLIVQARLEQVIQSLQLQHRPAAATPTPAQAHAQMQAQAMQQQAQPQPQVSAPVAAPTQPLARPQPPRGIPPAQQTASQPPAKDSSGSVVPARQAVTSPPKGKIGSMGGTAPAPSKPGSPPITAAAAATASRSPDKKPAQHIPATTQGKHGAQPSQKTSEVATGKAKGRPTSLGALPSKGGSQPLVGTPLPATPGTGRLQGTMPLGQPAKHAVASSMANAKKQPPMKQQYSRQSLYFNAQVKFLTDTQYPETWRGHVANSAFGSLFARHTANDLTAWSIFPKRPRDALDDEALDDMLFERDLRRVKEREAREAELMHDIFAQQSIP